MPSAKKLALLCGTTTGAAHKRLWRYRHGEIAEAELYAGLPEDAGLKPGGRCPVTGGLVTRISLAGFKDACKRKRDWRKYCLRGPSAVGEVKNIAPEWRRCEWCKGERKNWPEELAVIEMENQREENMGKKKTDAEKAEQAKAQAALEDHAIAEAMRECFGRELTVEQLARRCREEAEKAGRLEDELAALRDILKPLGDETLAQAAANQAKAASAWAALMDRARDAGFGEIADGDPVVMAGTYIMAVNEVMAERDKLKREQGELSPREKEALETLKTLDEDLDCARATIAELEARIEKLTAKAEPDGRTFDTMKGQMDDAVKDCLFEWALGQIADGKVELKMQILEASA